MSFGEGPRIVYLDSFMLRCELPNANLSQLKKLVDTEPFSQRIHLATMESKRVIVSGSVALCKKFLLALVSESANGIVAGDGSLQK